jgi:glycosyl transferase family 25
MAESQVLVIHVRGQEERRAFIQQQLDGLGLPVHFILEGNVADLTPEILDHYFVCDGKPDTMHGPFPRTSCAYKHLLATRYILDNGLDGALIVEDDIRFYPRFKRLFAESLKECADRYASRPVVINYEESSLLLVPRSQRVKGQLLYPADRDRYAGCYYLNRQAAQVIVDYVAAHKSDTTSDCLHCRLIQSGRLLSLWSHPCLACQCSADGSMPTMIPTKPRPLKRLKWWYKRIYKHILYFFR